MSYKQALFFDKRTYFQYYISLIKTKHPVIFAFFPKKDYNIVIVKISIILLSIAIYLGTNILFFNKMAIHNIYEVQGKFNINSQITKIIYSFLISHIISDIIKYIAISERDLLLLKYETNLRDSNKKVESLKRWLFIKYNTFYIGGFIFLAFFWYYSSSFCAVYKNSQFYPLINTLISILLSLLCPFLISLLPGFIRIPSLNMERGGEYLYKFSKGIQLL